MSLPEWKLRSSEPEQDEYVVCITGINDANPTKRYGRGITVTRTAEGVYKLTWAERPGVFVGVAGYCFGADTPSDVKGYTLTRDTPTTTAGVTTLEVSVWDSTFTAADLIAAQYLDLTLRFRGASDV